MSTYSIDDEHTTIASGLSLEAAQRQAQFQANKLGRAVSYYQVSRCREDEDPREHAERTAPVTVEPQPQRFRVTVGSKMTMVRVTPEHVRASEDPTADARDVAIARAVRKLYGRRAHWSAEHGSGGKLGKVTEAVGRTNRGAHNCLTRTVALTCERI